MLMNGAANTDKAKVLSAHSALFFANKVSPVFSAGKGVDELPAAKEN